MSHQNPEARVTLEQLLQELPLEDGGLVPDELARTRLRELEAALDQDRLVLNKGEFFDVWGRRLEVAEA